MLPSPLIQATLKMKKNPRCLPVDDKVVGQVIASLDDGCASRPVGVVETVIDTISGQIRLSIPGVERAMVSYGKSPQETNKRAVRARCAATSSSKPGDTCFPDHVENQIALEDVTAVEAIIEINAGSRTYGFALGQLMFKNSRRKQKSQLRYQSTRVALPLKHTLPTTVDRAASAWKMHEVCLPKTPIWTWADHTVEMEKGSVACDTNRGRPDGPHSFSQFKKIFGLTSCIKLLAMVVFMGKLPCVPSMPLVLPSRTIAESPTCTKVLFATCAPRT